MSAPLLEARDLCFAYPRRSLLDRRPPPALRDVNLEVHAGETLGVLGESGSGKSTLARCLVGLHTPQRGKLLLDGLSLGPADARLLFRATQMVFQDPRSSLNPRHRVGSVIADALAHEGGGRGGRRSRVEQCLREVGLEAAFVDRLPGELSGGQAQRVAIARALARRPRLLVFDEALASLDGTTRRELMALLHEHQRALNLAYVFISHDVPLVGELCDRVAVMRGGEVVEHGTRDEVLCDPQHAYTRALLAAVPRL
ncbi:MAG: ATP-binding cassette domain-containing protein [Polyangiales bacterium]